MNEIKRTRKKNPKQITYLERTKYEQHDSRNTVEQRTLEQNQISNTKSVMEEQWTIV